MNGWMDKVVVATGAVTAMGLLSSGVATATGPPNVVNKKYSDASAALSSAGYKAVVATRVGDDVPQSQCVVTFQQPEKMPAAGGAKKYRRDESMNVMVALSCYADKASQGEPGYSAGNPNAAPLEPSSNAAQSSSSSGSHH
jgi:hypothetical protein